MFLLRGRSPERADPGCGSKKYDLTEGSDGDANRLYEDTKQEYESIEEQVDTMDASIETYNRKLTETSMLKQQLENQIALLKEQIHSARMNDEHYANRAAVH